MNAMNTQMFIDLRAALHELAFDDALRVLVVTGAGDRAFSTGGDLKQRDGMTDHQWRRQHQLAEEVMLVVRDFPCPVIAAVEGHAHGGGCELALMCDWIVAGRTAVFSLPEVRRGIMPGGGGIQNLVRAAGARRARQLLLCARRFSAEQAAEWNIVTTLVDAGQALATAVAEAREVAGGADGGALPRRWPRAAARSISTAATCWTLRRTTCWSRPKTGAKASPPSTRRLPRWSGR